MSKIKAIVYRDVFLIVIFVALISVFIPQGCTSTSNKRSDPIVVNEEHSASTIFQHLENNLPKSIESYDLSIAYYVDSFGINRYNNLNIKCLKDGFLAVKINGLTDGTCVFDKDWQLIGIVVSKDKQNVIIADINKIKQILGDSIMKVSWENYNEVD